MTSTLRSVGHEDRLSLVEHLTELRVRIIICLVAFVGATAVCFWQNQVVLDILSENREKVVVGLNASGQVREFQLRSKVSFRLRTPPDSGGSFGVKQGVFPYVVLVALAARVCGRPVKWIEDRLEHLSASVSATNRVTRLEAAVEADGRVTALSYDQIEDVGAHVRAPEPATLYRMQGNLTGAYAIENVAVRNRVVLTNKTPTGLNRGFGGPQVYYALERLMQRIAVALKLDPLDVIRRNLVPSGAFPYRTASGGLLDSGDYPEALRRAIDSYQKTSA